MKKLIYFFVLFLSINAAAQTENIPAKIVFTNGQEIKAKVRMNVNMFYSDLVDESFILQNKIAVADARDKFAKYPAGEIQSLTFIDLKNRIRFFTRLQNYRYLVEVIHDGKINWYRSFYKNGYDRSTQQADFLQKGNEERLALSILSDNKKNLKELMADRPDVFPLIEQINYNRMKDSDLIEILNRYDEQITTNIN